MLARYKMYRGPRPDDDPLPEGIRQDTRKHTTHCLRPTAEMVASYLGNPSEAAWRRFATAYRALLDERFAADAKPFRELADLAARQDVFIGCSCPTAKNPDPLKCHTILALAWMKKRFGTLDVVLPGKAGPSG